MLISKKLNLATLLLAAGMAYSAEVMTWVPPYAIEGSKNVLQKSYGGVAVTDGISRVGLQFWNVDTLGGLYYLDGSATDADVNWFVNWKKDKNIKVLLTVVNIGRDFTGYNSFDWNLTRKALGADSGKTLINNLLKTVDQFNLDGVDLDIEGEGNAMPYTLADETTYATFVNALGDSLHARNKLLTIDTYSSPGVSNVPNPNWFSKWSSSKVDQIHTMGYSQNYWSAPGNSGYQAQQNLFIKTGFSATQGLLGMPMWLNAWSGNSDGTGTTNVANLNYVLNCLDAQTGVTLWDIHHPGSLAGGDIPVDYPWTQDSVWVLLKALKNGQQPNKALCPSVTQNPKIVDLFEFKGLNPAGGTLAANSDFWSRSEAIRDSLGTKVYNPEQDHDMVAGYGVWGDIAKGYVTLSDETNVFQMIIKGKSLINGTIDGGVIVNMLPINQDQDPAANPWEMSKVGVDKNLSAYKTLVVGAQCTAGKKLRITVNSKAEAANYSKGAFGKSFTCTDKFEDYVITFADLKRTWGSDTTTGFDASKTLRVSIEYVDAVPGINVVTLAGIALDTSVVQLRGKILNEVTTPKILGAISFGKRSHNFVFQMTDRVRVLSLTGALKDEMSYSDYLNNYANQFGLYIPIKVNNAP